VSADDGLLTDALVEAIAARGAEVGGPVVIGDPADPVLGAIAGLTGRVVAAPGAASRLLVGIGVAGGGSPAVVLAGPGTLPPREVPEGVTAVTNDLAVAEALRGAGWVVAQPVWPADLPTLFEAAMEGGEAVVLRLHTRPLDTPNGTPPPALGLPRVLADGHTGVVVAAGWLVAKTLDALPALLAHGLSLALVDAHTRRPQVARSALAEADTRLLVGGPQAAADLAAGRLRLAALRAIEVPPGADMADLLAERVPLHG
jgi:hypothetical protein